MNKNNDIETINICKDLSQFSDSLKVGNKDMGSVLEELQEGTINSVYSAMDSFMAAVEAQKKLMDEAKEKIRNSRLKAGNTENTGNSGNVRGASLSNSAYSGAQCCLK